MFLVPCRIRLCLRRLVRSMVIRIISLETGIASLWFAKIHRVTEAEGHLVQLELVAGEANAYRVKTR
jgi:hypothetical protein